MGSACCAELHPGMQSMHATSTVLLLFPTGTLVWDEKNQINSYDAVVSEESSVNINFLLLNTYIHILHIEEDYLSVFSTLSGTILL